ncbi:MAG: sugar phosphate isomerase/epimerase [Lachnospiraceae bacterium]|nr:sugar phosphate isomerase/epimerase [Lachnospiraceae bacterium]
MTIKAVQQFQLGTVLNNEKQAAKTLRLMKEAGYDGIELCSFMIHPTPFMVKILTKAAGMPVGNGGKLDWPKLVKEAGLSVPSVHQYLNSIEEDPENAAKEAISFGSRYVTVTGMYRFDYGDSKNIHSLAERLNKAGEALAAQGIGLLYHNHNIEFLRPEPDKTAYRILMEETDPKYVNFEFDSYWAVDAGVYALGLMEQLGSRLKLYHINDRGCRQKGLAMTPLLKMDSMELGTGCLDLEPMIRQALSVDVDAIILESHKNWIDKSPVKSFQVSGEYLRKYL